MRNVLEIFVNLLTFSNLPKNNMDFSHIDTTPLNLPALPVPLRLDRQGRPQVQCLVRKRWLVATPEERVRQHFLRYMVECLGYSPHRLAVEMPLELNGTRRRVDALVYDDVARPLAVVEFKAPDVNISQQVVDQIARYNLALCAPYLIISNGLRHYCCRVDVQSGRYEFLRAIPPYQQIK